MTEDSERRDEIGALVDAVNGYRESLVNGRELAAAAEQDRQRFLAGHRQHADRAGACSMPSRS